MARNSAVVDDPWAEASSAAWATRTDASAVADYFKPLDEWLTKQNKNEKCGW
jgi:peptidyl-dipeptidase A